MTSGWRGFVDALDLSLWQKLRLGLAVPVMKEIICRFWNDPAYFTALVRASIALLAGQILSGQIPLPPGRAGAIVWALATYWGVVLALPAGQTNKTDVEVKREAHDPNVPPPLPSDSPPAPYGKPTGM